MESLGRQRCDLEGDVVNRRLAAIASLVLLAASVGLAGVVVGVQGFPAPACRCSRVWLLACWQVCVLVHRGAARFAAAAGAGVLLAGAVVLFGARGPRLEDVSNPGGAGCSRSRPRVGCSRSTRGLPVATVPKRPVLFYNPKSGGGKAERFEVAREAARGVEPVAALHLGDDLATLVRGAIENGADALGVAGGDGRGDRRRDRRGSEGSRTCVWRRCGTISRSISALIATTSWER